jgi:hypothetical protein
MGTMHNKGRMYYDELLDRGLKDRAIKGYGKSQVGACFLFNCVHVLLLLVGLFYLLSTVFYENLAPTTIIVLKNQDVSMF